MAARYSIRPRKLLSSSRTVAVETAIGVVSQGYVTVGVIRGTARLEFVAAGPALNLAARLCDRAQAGHAMRASMDP
jgi:class 3 adenylate cyclase